MKYNIVNTSLAVITILSFLSCKDNIQPKPDAFLNLEYPEAKYEVLKSNCPFEFEKNTTTNIKDKSVCNLEIYYPSMKATIFINYKPIDNNLSSLLKDAQKLTYEHFIKAEEIIEQPYINPEDKVYGMFYEVTGDAATNVQFYATDSVKNFMVASLYFYIKPNYDSILPASNYIKNDMYRIMETIKWK